MCIRWHGLAAEALEFPSYPPAGATHKHKLASAGIWRARRGSSKMVLASPPWCRTTLVRARD